MAINPKEFVTAFMRDEFPDLDFRPGTGVYDILAAPMFRLTETFQTTTENVRRQLSLLNASEMSEVDVDRLIANFFISRKEGAKSLGKARITLTTSESFIIPADGIFIHSSGVKFKPLSGHSISISDLTNIGNTIYIDITLQSLFVGDATNVNAGEFVSFPVLSNKVARVEALSPFTGGVDKETNDAIVRRTKNAITVRNLINRRSISTVMEEEFPVIKQTKVVGFGERGMDRDLVRTGVLPDTGQTCDLHVGGFTDIHAQTTILQATDTGTIGQPSPDDLAFIDASTNELVISSDIFTNKPMLRLRQVLVNGNIKYDFNSLANRQQMKIVFDTENQVELTTNQAKRLANVKTVGTDTEGNLSLSLLTGAPVHALKGSIFEEFKLKFGNVLATGDTDIAEGNSIVVIYDYASDFTPIQEYLDSESNRVISSNQVAKTFVPVYVDMELSVSPAAGGQVLSISSMLGAIKAHLAAIPAGGRIEHSDLVDLLYNQGARFIQLPFTIRAIIVTPSGSPRTRTYQDTSALLREEDITALTAEVGNGVAKDNFVYVANNIDITIV